MHDQAATTATPHGTRGPPEVPAWRRVCGSSGGLVRGLMISSTFEQHVFVKCKPSGSTQRSTVLPERAGADADVKAGALRRPVKLPPGCPGRRYTRHVTFETADLRRRSLLSGFGGEG